MTKTQTTTLHVDVRDSGDHVLERAKVRLVPTQQSRAKAIDVSFDRVSGGYRASGIGPGRYRLSARQSGLEKQESDITVAPAGGREIVVLGKKGQPYYHRGRVKVPFEPRPDLLAVTTAYRADDDEVGDRVSSVARDLGLEEQPVHEHVAQSRVRVFSLGKRATEQRMAEAVGQLVAQPEVRHGGPVVAVRETSVSYLTHEGVIQFEPGVTEDRVRAVIADAGLELLRAVPYAPNAFHVASPRPASYAFLDVLNGLVDREEVAWAEPNIASSMELDSVVPSDYLWNGLWDRQLVRLPAAWQELQDAGLPAFGAPTVVIADVDQGIKSTGGAPDHPEFQGNVSDGSSKVLTLYDFTSLVANNDTPLGNHGMGTSGVATALANDASATAGYTEGLTGAAPNCRVMGLIFSTDEVDQADMYVWAAGFNPNSPRLGYPAPPARGADVITCSIGFGAGAPLSGVAKAALDFVTTYGRGGKGCLCFFSSGNANTNSTTYRPWSAYEKSFGIAASSLAADGTTEIRGDYSDFGPGIALCAPSNDTYVGGRPLHDPPTHHAPWSCDLAGQGNLFGAPTLTTTLSAAAAAGATSVTLASVAGIAVGWALLLEPVGANGGEPVMVTGAPNAATGQVPVAALLHPHAAGAPVAGSASTNYRNNFGGTSSATPLAAGCAALVLSANPELTWVEARQVLRDSAVRFDTANSDPVGQWIDASGNPSRTSGLPPVFSQWYGYGRVDAAAAVQQALAYAFARDLVGRDNLADVGSVPSIGAFWDSPDLWVRNVAPGVEGAAALPAGYAVPGPHLSPRSGQDNWVYARVRNVGTVASLDAYVRIYVAHYPGFEFGYPAAFEPTTRPGATPPVPLTPGTYLLGEVKVTGIAPGADTIVNVTWPAALVPPADVVVGGMTVHWHPCLLLEVSPHDGPAPTGDHVWDSNNLAQKNVTVVYVDSGDEFAAALVMGSLTNDTRFHLLEVDRSVVPPGVRLYVDLVHPKLTSFARARIREEAYEPVGVATLLDPTRISLEKPHGDGGVVLTVPPSTMIERLVVTNPLLTRKPNVRLVSLEGREAFEIGARGRAWIPVFNGGGTLSPIVVRGVVGKGVDDGVYRLPLIQRDAHGARTGGAVVEIHVGQDER